MTTGLLVMLFNNTIIQNYVTLIKRFQKQRPFFIFSWLRRKYFIYYSAISIPLIAERLTADKISKKLGFRNSRLLFHATIDNTPFPIFKVNRSNFIASIQPDSRQEIILRAQKAMRREVSLLGSKNVKLEHPINWALDFKSGIAWPMKPSPLIDIMDLNQNSDIKVPWELSRLQWLLPTGQAYIIEKKEEYALQARVIIEDWINGNPICLGPNWHCPMDVALRAISICWLFNAFYESNSWNDQIFYDKLIVQLYLHAIFILKNLEWSDVNGNHLVTNLTGLIIISILLGNRGEAATWGENAWQILVDELPKQVPNDGVCREASIPYHRLVSELFLLPALARDAAGLSVDPTIWTRLKEMGNFVTTYTLPCGHVPVWGDADDGRALPLGTQALNDHRYLAETLLFCKKRLAKPLYDETLWWLGPGHNIKYNTRAASSSIFTNAGVFIFRNSEDYIFIDAGPVGMAGRGGHGHNDCLSFETTLRGVRLVIDTGSYVYTPDWKSRNQFRSTKAHNTPLVDHCEINRFPRPDWLWYAEDNAKPTILDYAISEGSDWLIASHSGYNRLLSPVTPFRLFILDKKTHSLLISDKFCSSGEHETRIPFHLDANLKVKKLKIGVWELTSKTGPKFFFVYRESGNWEAKIEDGWASPSYGLKHKIKILVFKQRGPLTPLTVALFPKLSSTDNPKLMLSNIISNHIKILNKQDTFMQLLK